MRRNSALTAEDLLNTLLDKIESGRERSRDITHSIDYKQVGEPAAQDNLHRILQDAERAGCIRLEKNRLGRFTGEFARVRLIDAVRLYQFLGRSPAVAIANEAQQAIGAAIPE